MISTKESYYHINTYIFFYTFFDFIFFSHFSSYVWVYHAIYLLQHLEIFFGIHTTYNLNMQDWLNCLKYFDKMQRWNCAKPFYILNANLRLFKQKNAQLTSTIQYNSVLWQNNLKEHGGFGVNLAPSLRTLMS